MTSSVSRDELTACIQAVLASETFRGIRAYDINCGLCDQFAEAVVAAFPQAQWTWIEELPGFDEFAHAVSTFRGRFYDAEAPNGVDSPRDLPLVQHSGDRNYHNQMAALRVTHL